MIKIWLISAVSTVMLMTLLELFLSEGNIKKYAQGIMRLALVIVLLYPAMWLVNNDFTLDSVMPTATTNESIVNESFLSRISEARYKQTELSIQNSLRDNGIIGAVVSINIYYGNNGLTEISSVYVDLLNAVITENNENIISNDDIKLIVRNYLSINSEQIIIYGKA